MPTVVLSKNDHFCAEVSVHFEEKRVSLRLIGEVTERSELAAIWDYVARLGNDVKQVSFDMGEVTRLNSEGIVRWLQLLNRAQSRLSCRFTMLSVPMIQQAVVVKEILGKPGTAVDAFQAPFFCDSCGKETAKVLDAEMVGRSEMSSWVVPAISCDQCGKVLRFDDHETEYFRFLSGRTVSRNRD